MKIFKYIIFTLIILPFCACEEPAVLSLKPVEPRLVINAMIGNLEPCYVALSLTQDYLDQEIPSLVAGAEVTLMNNETGEIEELHVMGEDGIFQSDMSGESGVTYTLTVNLDGKQYVATDRVPEPVAIQFIGTYKVDTGADVYFYPTISFLDPKGLDNYYYYKLAINGRDLQGLRFDDDKYSDGKWKERVVFFNNEDDNVEDDIQGLRPYDDVSVELQSIGKGAYTFYKTKEADGGTPTSNPTGNFSGDVLGIFKTYASYYLSATITEEDLE